MISPLLNEVVAEGSPEPMLFTTDQYHRLSETGVLIEGSPVELIEGVIVLKDRRDGKDDTMIYGPRHGYSLAKLFARLDDHLESVNFHVRNQNPVTLTDKSEPEPDLAVVRGAMEDYAERHPAPNEIVALIEVADSSLRFDRSTKQRIYATANIPIYWIVNLPDRQVEVFEQPDATRGEYLSKSQIDESGEIQLSLPGETSIVRSVADFLPPVNS